MNKTIHIREAVTPEEVERFWQELHAYHARDIFPDPAEEDRAYSVSYTHLTLPTN